MAQKNGIVRIALIGPESTAKSTLSEALAKHYNTVWVPEYARTYLNGINRKYTLEDIVKIAKEQLLQEQNKLASANKLIFVDTELIISKIWCEEVFNTSPEWIIKNILEFKYDLYLLTSPDLPWEKDPLRENPHRRQFLFDRYESELKNIQANYKIIDGTGDNRLKKCIAQVDLFLP